MFSLHFQDTSSALTMPPFLSGKFRERNLLCGCHGMSKLSLPVLGEDMMANNRLRWNALTKNFRSPQEFVFCHPRTGFAVAVLQH